MPQTAVPAPILGRAKQCCETSAGIETRPAKPIDGPFPTDEGRGRAVADEGVILNRRMRKWRERGHSVLQKDRQLSPEAHWRGTGAANNINFLNGTGCTPAVDCASAGAK